MYVREIFFALHALSVHIFNGNELYLLFFFFFFRLHCVIPHTRTHFYLKCVYNIYIYKY